MRDLINKLDSFDKDTRFRYLNYAKVSNPSIPEDFYIIHIIDLYKKIAIINDPKKSKREIEEAYNWQNQYAFRNIIDSFIDVIPKKKRKTDFDFEEAFDCSIELLERIEEDLFAATNIEIDWASTFRSELVVNSRFLKAVSAETSNRILNSALDIPRYYRVVSKLVGKIKGVILETNIIDHLTDCTDILERAKVCPFIKDQEFNRVEIQTLLDKAISENNIAKILNLKRILGKFTYTGNSFNSTYHHLWNKNNKTISLEEELSILEAEERGELKEFLLDEKNEKLTSYLVLFDCEAFNNDWTEHEGIYDIAVGYFFNHVETDPVLKEISIYEHEEKLKDFIIHKGFEKELNIVKPIRSNYVSLEQIHWIQRLKEVPKKFYELEAYNFLLQLHKKDKSFLSDSDLEYIEEIRKAKRKHKYKELTANVFLDNLLALKGTDKYAFVEAQYKEGNKERINRFMNYFYHLNNSKQIYYRNEYLPISLRNGHYDYRHEDLSENVNEKMLLKGIVDSLNYVSEVAPDYTAKLVAYFLNEVGSFLFLENKSNRYSYRVKEMEQLKDDLHDFISKDDLKGLIDDEILNSI